MEEQPAVEDLRSRGPGVDPADPYEDVDLDTLPAWWRRAIEEFEAHDLRPYRPPRFADGSLVHEAIAALEAEFGIAIRIGCVGTDYREHWTVRVDGEPAGTVGRHRSTAGYTVYEVDRGTFEALVRESCADD